MATNLKLSRSYHSSPSLDQCMYTPAELLDIRGTRHPEREAFVIRDIGKPREVMTFGELKTKTEELAAGMIKRGQKKGDSVGLFCSTSLEYPVCEYALARTGAIVIRFHVSVKSGEDLLPQMKKGECKWMLVQLGVGDENYKTLQNIIPSLHEHDPAQKISADDLPDLEAIFMISSASYPGTEPWTVFFEGNTVVDFETLRKRQDSIELDDIQCCLATSGSTGTPKLVAHSCHMSVNIAWVTMSSFGIGEADRRLTDRPMPYIGGHSGAVISKGLTLVYVKASATVSNKDGKDYFFEIFEEERCTALSLFPYMIQSFLQKVESGELDIKRIKLAVTGGERSPKPLFERILKHVPHFINVYGSTEGGGYLLGGKPDDSAEERCTYTGRGYTGEFKIIDTDGQIVPVNTSGELCFKSHAMFRYYWGDEEKTRQAIDALGWYKTGDMATMNEDGYISILGRQREVISKATIKIYPQSIEKEAQRHPSVESAVAVGVPHEILFEEIALCVVPKKDVTLTVDDLRQFCRERFRAGEDGQGLMPDYFLLFDRFPEGATNKTDRKLTREEAIARLNQK